jgi:hypothetical protein
MIQYTIITIFLFAAMATATLAEDDCPPTKTGLYRNEEYGYSVTIPAGLKGAWNSPCQMDPKDGCICIGAHGLTVPLEAGASLDFFAGYTALEHPSLPDILRFTLKDVGPQGPDNVTVRMSQLEKTLLAGRPAYRFVASYEKEGDDYTEERIVSADTEVNVDYAISLSAPSKRFAILGQHFTQLVRSWRWTPVARNTGKSKVEIGKKRGKK